MPTVNPAFARQRVAKAADYDVVDADLEHACDQAVAVWGNTIGWPGRQAEMYRRYYLECPVGRPALKFLRHVPSGRIVGTLGVCPRHVRWHGQDIRAGVLSHLCVLKAHRTVRPPLLLLKRVVAACRGRYDLVYAMPRTPGGAALARLFQGPPLCVLRRRVKVLRHAKYAARWLPRPLAAVAGATVDAALVARGSTHTGLRAKWIDHADPRMAALWHDSDHAPAWNAARDPALLRWRFDRLPARRRRYLLLHDERDGALRAWFACDDNYFDPDILAVQDFWAAGGPAAIERGAIRALSAAARALGFAAVDMRLAAPDASAAAWLAEGFHERNRRPVFMAWLNPLLPRPAPDDVYFTELDDDG